jgi:type II secretory pathway pseudopilin PulG
VFVGDPHEAAVIPGRAAACAGPACGFTVIELLVALAIVMSITGILAQVVEPARAAFDRVPAELDLQQRGRTAIDQMSQSMRSAISMIVPASERLTVMVPVVNGAQGVLSADHLAGAVALSLATAPCPNIKDVCGFTPGAFAIIVDASHQFEVVEVVSTTPGTRTFVGDRGLSRPYSIGSAVIEIDQYTFSLALQADGSLSLIRETAAGAIQPMVDFVTALSFRVTGQQVDFSVTVQAPTTALRRILADRVFKSSVNVRNGI